MGSAKEKHFPRAVAKPAQTDRDRLVLGGSLTRSAEGRLQTLQTHGIYPSPQGVQQVWSNASRRRYPKAWEGQPLEPVGHVIEWEPREIACGACARSLGKYVAYRVLYPNAAIEGERGIVENTSRRYEAHAETAKALAGSRGPKTRNRFRLEGEIGRSAKKTTAFFRCPGCRREYQRNLFRLGKQLFEHPNESTFTLE
jgi:hypothetical protein